MISNNPLDAMKDVELKPSCKPDDESKVPTTPSRGKSENVKIKLPVAEVENAKQCLSVIIFN